MAACEFTAVLAHTSQFDEKKNDTLALFQNLVSCLCRHDYAAFLDAFFFPDSMLATYLSFQELQQAQQKRKKKEKSSKFADEGIKINFDWFSRISV